MENDTWALVDLGWVGKLQNSVRKILDLSGYQDKPIYGFYFGLLKKYGDEQRDVRWNYFFSPHDESECASVGLKFINILEILTAADHGTVLSYQNINGKIEPILKENKNNASWDLQALRTGIFSFIDKLQDPLELSDEFLRAKILNIMEALINQPTKEEADALGSHLFSGDQTESYLSSVAPKYSFNQCVYDAFTEEWSYKDKNRLSLWREGSWARNGFIMRKIMSAKSRTIFNKIGLLWYSHSRKTK